MKKQVCLLLFSVLIFSDKVFSKKEPSMVRATNLVAANGVTVIVHGFQLTGSLPNDFVNYAHKIRTRLNGNATIYVNKSSRNRHYWQEIAGNGGGEKIFVYDWGADSNTPSMGPLESAADKLFCMLVDPYDENGNRIVSTARLLDQSVHFIAHSRGAILSLQVFHRIGKYFPNKKITQFTALDPHPAGLMGDVTLAGVNGIVQNCSSLFCSNADRITIDIPSNVLFAECFYRQKGVYEEALNFDGVSANGAANVQLKDATLLQGGNSLLAHSLVHEWYFGTVDLTTSLPAIWYSQTGGRQNSGWNNSRLGGNSYKNGVGRISIQSMDAKIELRQNTPMNEIFNGTIVYQKSTSNITNTNNPSNWSASGFNGANVIISNNTLFPNFNNQKQGEVIYNSLFYVSPKRKYLKFDVISSNMNPQTQIMLHWNNGTTKDNDGVPSEPFCAPQQAGTKTYYAEIPSQFIGHTATFKLVFRSSINMGNFAVDNFILTDNPEGNDVFSGYCCNHNVSISPNNAQTICAGESVTLTANSNNPSSYRWFKNGKYIGSGSSITADTTASYSVIAKKNGVKCSASASISVTRVENTTIKFKIQAAIPNNNPCAYDSTSKTITLCAGQSTTLTGTGCDGTITWNTGVSTNAITVNQAGNYTATCRIGQNCQKSDNVIVKIEQANTASIANAGIDNAYCGKQTITLNGNTPTYGCGTWNIVSPTGADVGTFSDIHNPTATFTPKQFGTYRLQWTISLVCGSNSSSDLVDLNFVENKEIQYFISKSITKLVGSEEDKTFYFFGSPLGGVIEETLIYNLGCTNFAKNFPQF
jgi:hypothetical protein